MRDISFSIIVCTYNRAAQLAKALGTVNALELPAGVAAQLVVVNNNSPDDTASVCRQFAAASRFHFTYCEEREQGLSHARNRGLAVAEGAITIFTDDDVTVPSDWLVNYTDVFMRTDADCVFGKIIPDWGADGPPPWYDDGFSMIFGKLDYGDLEFSVTSRRQEFFGANFAIRRDLVTTYRGFDPTLGRTPDKLYISEERKLFLRLLADRRKMVYCPSIYVHHHVSDRMRSRQYVRQYYWDTAVSLVNITPANTSRQLFGVPYFRCVELARTLAMFLPRAAVRIVCGQRNKLFVLTMELMRMVRVVFLHFQRRHLIRR